MPLKLAVLSVLALTATAKAETPAPLATLALAAPLAALDGRVLVSLPAGARDEARQSSIMAAPESADSESRLLFDSDDRRLVVMVWELFALAPQDLVAAAKAELGEDGSTHEIATIPVSDAALRAVRARPEAPALENNAALIDSAYIALADGTAIRIAIFVNAAAFADLAGARTLAEKIIASAKGGTRRLPRHAGTRALGTLMVTVPEDVVVSTQLGPDFKVYLLRQMRQLGSPPPSTLGVYVGDHPEYIHRRVEYQGVAVVKVPGQLLGRATEWDSWSAPGGMHTQEVIAPLAPSDPKTMVHAFISGQSPREVETMRRTAESLRVTESL